MSSFDSKCHVHNAGIAQLLFAWFAYFLDVWSIYQILCLTFALVLTLILDSVLDFIA